jgi:hypothetical protein
MSDNSLIEQESSALISAADAAGMSVVAREEAEIKAAIVSAKKFPRDEMDSYSKMLKTFSRASLAKDAKYSFPRGGKKVEGPSAPATREMARCWGNIRHGIRVVSIDDDYVHIKGYAIDLETNTSAEAEDKFKRLIFRKGKGWIKPDERDLRELINRRGAIAVRNCILQILPDHVVDDVMQEANATSIKHAKGELEKNREDVLKSLVVAFDEFGITSEIIEAKLGHDLKSISPEELTELRGVYKSIKDGNTTRDEHFDVSSREADDLTAKIKGE